jgi:dihydroorotase-like cyclic amidohydrolase
MHNNPRRIYNLPEQSDTRIEVEMRAYTIPERGWQTKCGWTPFAGLAAGGRIRRVVLRSEVVYEDGCVLAKPGTGRIVM